MHMKKYDYKVIGVETRVGVVIIDGESCMGS